MISILFRPAIAQIRKVKKFKGVEVQFSLKHEDTVLKKDKYDFEIIVHRTLRQFYLRIIKKGKALCIVPGEILRDKPPGARGEEMPEVPEEPTLKISRIPAKKIANIIFETGKLTEIFPCYKIRFQMEYKVP
jgi:hypothetical protein